MGCTTILVLSVLLSMGMNDGPYSGDVSASRSRPAAEVAMPAGLGRRMVDVTEAVLRHHPSPPARQQMILEGIRGLYQLSGLPFSTGLSRRISGMSRPEEFEALLLELWPNRPVKAHPASVMEEALVSGMLSTVPGGAHWTSAKENRVQEQFQGNRYVGIHIQLKYEEKEKRAVILGIVPGGPADRAGAKKEDRIEAIDDHDTRDMKLTEVIDRLRGESGTNLVVQVRQPGSKEVRTLTMTRGPLFIPTVLGLYRRSSGEWEYGAGGPEAIGYLRLQSLTASTPHELRQHAQELETQGFHALVLDLRGLGSTALHPVTLVADSLLDHGRIGRVWEADGVRNVEATPGALFPGWPLAVLIDEQTSGAGEWLAAALQDNHRGVLIGSRTMGSQPRRERPPSRIRQYGAAIWSTVPVGQSGEEGFLNLITGRFERGDGRQIEAAESETDREVTTEPRKDAQAVGGIKPDRSVTPRRQGRKSESVSMGMLGDLPPAVDPWTDTVLIEAVKELSGSRERLGKETQ